jgi:hypothetical protein
MDPIVESNRNSKQPQDHFIKYVTRLHPNAPGFQLSFANKLIVFCFFGTIP